MRGLPVILWLSLSLSTLVAQPFQFLPELKSITYQEGELFLAKPDFGYSFEGKPSPNNQVALAQCHVVLDAFRTISPVPSGKGQAKLIIAKSGQNKHLDSEFAGELEEIGDQGYVIKVDIKHITVLANTDQGIFYAMVTLKQLLQQNKRLLIPCLTIVDYPTIKVRVWQDDISRGPIPNMDFLKEEIKRLSQYKLNALTLYTENVYKYKSHPDIAPPDGLTETELRELVAYGKQYHVDIIGNQQSFGHMDKVLRVPAYADLAETPGVLSPAVEGTYSLLKDWYAEIVPDYPSPYFLINCDEVSGLGTGPAKAMLATQSKAEIYTSHINKVYELLKPYDKQVMMWGDVALHSPEILDQLPKDIIMVPWDYAALPSYRAEIDPIKAAGFPFFVAPGVSNWGRIWPNMETAFANIGQFVWDGYQTGTEGVILTTWDDDGMSLFEDTWMPLVWGAAQCWSPKDPADTASRREFIQLFDREFYQLPEKSFGKLFFDISDLGKFPVIAGLYNAITWEDLIQLDFPYSAADIQEATLQTNALQKELKDIQVINHNQINSTVAAELALEWINWVLQKRMVQRYLADHLLDGTVNAGQMDRLLTNLRGTLLKIRSKYQLLYKAENRSYYLDKNLEKFDRELAGIIELPKRIVFIPDNNPFGTIRTITLATVIPGEEIVFTTDGSDPIATSTIYQVPVFMDHSGTLKARVIDGNEVGPVFEKQLYVHDGFVEKVSFEEPYSPQYAGSGPVTLVDHQSGSENFRDGQWLGFVGKDLNATLELGSMTSLKSLNISFLESQTSWIFYPTEVKVEASEDGKHYTTIGKVNWPLEQDEADVQIKTASFQFPDMPVKFIRVLAKNVGKNPEWHVSPGAPCWLFVDEIGIEKAQE